MAELCSFATKKKSDEGVIFPVQFNGVKLPMALKIYGENSDYVKNYRRERLRKLKLSTENGNPVIENEELEELLESNANVTIRIGGIYSYDWEKGEVIENEPVTLYQRELKNDKNSYNYLIENIPEIASFIIKKSQSKTDFLESGTKN